ncbi:MAG: TolC family outer membrane protein [Wenzhouxiangella sp.]
MIKKTAVALGLSLALSPLAFAVDLLGVYELAQTNDAELRAAERRLAVAGEIPVQTRAALLPQLSGSASQTLGESSSSVDGNSLPTNDIDQRNYSIQLRQSIYDDANYGRLARGRAELAAADARYREAFQSFLFRVSERYFDVLTAVETLRFSEAEETALRRQFEQAEQRFEVGLAAVTDVHEARATWDGARARVIVAQNALEDAREAMRETTGTWFENFAALIEDVPLSPPDPTDAREWVQAALESSPQVLQQRSQVDVADAELRIARAGHLPTLGLSGSYSRNQNNEFVARDPETQSPIGTTTFRTDGWQLGLTLEIPIFEGFATVSRRRQAGESLRLADDVLDQAERAVVRQTETAYRSVIAGIREVEARRQALISAESALEATNAGFEVGTRTIVDVLISEQRLFQAQRNYSDARHQFILNGLRLRQAAGLLDEQDLVEVNQLLR